jgi:hypothetical protein
MQFSGIVYLRQALHETSQKWGSVCPLKAHLKGLRFPNNFSLKFIKKAHYSAVSFGFEQFHLNQKTAMQKRQCLRVVFNAELAHLL